MDHDHHQHAAADIPVGAVRLRESVSCCAKTDSKCFTNHFNEQSRKEKQMSQKAPTRRAVLIGGTALMASLPLRTLAQAAGPAIHVLKDPNCGCCTAWIEILENENFAVTVEPSAGTELMQYKIASGIPEEMASCHTARINGYMIEGHVPVADIRRLLDERPDAVGLAVPGMPYGSPGMGPESEREAYDVFLIRRKGVVEPFSRYEA